MARKKSVKRSINDIKKIKEFSQIDIFVDEEVLRTEIECIEKDSEKDLDDSDFEQLGDAEIIESILYKIPIVSDPLIGTPKQVQKELNKIALYIKKYPNTKKSDNLYNKIHLYMHGYLINVALKQFPYIKGYQTTDVYQESLIALRFKAIPNFKNNKGMSFLNFAKMCIRRHLITILNASYKRKKDQSINMAVPIDVPVNEDDESSTLSNIIGDENTSFEKVTENKEVIEHTKKMLSEVLSTFEQCVLEEYLTGSSYKEIAKSITDKTNKRCVPKAVDNALLRIRKKAAFLKENGDREIPLFI